MLIMLVTRQRLNKWKKFILSQDSGFFSIDLLKCKKLNTHVIYDIYPICLGTST